MRRLILAAYVVGVLVVTVQRGVFDFANDFAIFRAASQNLAAGRDLYVLRPAQATDLFKYSPAFALLFTPFAVLPFTLGLALWNLAGALLLLQSLRRLLPERESRVAQLAVYLAMLRNTQSAQSNSLVAALIIFAFVTLEDDRPWRAAGLIGIGAAIKVFPLAATLLVWPHRARRTFAMALGTVGVLLAVLPLAVTSGRTLVAQYESWWGLHAGQQLDVGQSAMTVVNSGLILLAGASIPQWTLQLAGTALLLLPVAVSREAFARDRLLRLQLLSSILLYAVLFNHKAEAQSYVIAVAGVAVWWASSPRSAWRAVVAVLVVACTNLPSSDVVPVAVKAAMTPLWRGPIPCSALWLYVQVEMLWRLHVRHRRDGLLVGRKLDVALR